MSLSEVARGKLVMAAKDGRPIPPGWALDAEGNPTTDARAGLDGSMLAMGGTKGAMLALVVELLVTTLTGAALGFEASTLFVDEGNRPRAGPRVSGHRSRRASGRGVYDERIETLIAAMSRRSQECACPASAAKRWRERKAPMASRFRRNCTIS